MSTPKKILLIIILSIPIGFLLTWGSLFVYSVINPTYLNVSGALVFGPCDLGFGPESTNFDANQCFRDSLKDKAFEFFFLVPSFLVSLLGLSFIFKVNRARAFWLMFFISAMCLVSVSALLTYSYATQRVNNPTPALML